MESQNRNICKIFKWIFVHHNIFNILTMYDQLDIGETNVYGLNLLSWCYKKLIQEESWSPSTSSLSCAAALQSCNPKINGALSPTIFTQHSLGLPILFSHKFHHSASSLELLHFSFLTHDQFNKVGPLWECGPLLDCY